MMKEGGENIQLLEKKEIFDLLSSRRVYPPVHSSFFGKLHRKKEAILERTIRAPLGTSKD